jgi:phage repressor protein C with HTH and peptisase S24 domain
MLFVARGIGGSMMPTILDSDIVIVDRSQRTAKLRDQIWAMSLGDIGMIKRLRPSPDGSMRILSDNNLVPEDQAGDGELHIVGRVVAIVRKV